MNFIPEQTLIFLYSGKDDIYSHQIRIILQEKEASSEIIIEDLDDPSEDFLELSPYQTLPILTDKNLVLFDNRTIMEYMDERFPFPPLMPVDPENKAEIRQMLMRIDQDWVSKAIGIKNSGVKRANILRKELSSSLGMLSIIFKQHKYFLYDEYTLLDCALAPLLWRLDDLEVKLPKNSAPIQEYAKRLFDRDNFRNSLTEYEEEIHA